VSIPTDSVLRAFHVSDEEFWAGYDAASVARLYEETTGDPCLDDYPIELTEAELDHRYPAFDEDERPIEGETVSPREWLAEMTEPGFLAGSYW
jgi:hypothetical protein